MQEHKKLTEMRSLGLKQVKKHKFQDADGKRNTSHELQHLLLCKKSNQIGSKPKAEDCPEKATATERRQCHQMINKCTGFGTRKNWIQILLQKL